MYLLHSYLSSHKSIIHIIRIIALAPPPRLGTGDLVLGNRIPGNWGIVRDWAAKLCWAEAASPEGDRLERGVSTLRYTLQRYDLAPDGGTHDQ